MTSVVIFNDVIFPDRIIAMGVAGKNARVNERTRNQGGFPMADIVRGTLREITLGYVPLSPQDWATIEGLHEVTAGGAYGMLMKDPKDSLVRTGEGVLRGYVNSGLAGVAGFGYGVPTLRMFQRKAAQGTSRTFDRRIARPITPSALLRAGSPVTFGVAAGNAAINYDTGAVTFVADASQNVSSVTVGATTQVALAAPLAGLVAGTGRLYLQGLTGADAALLNGQSHLINTIVGSTYTLAVSTLGKTITPAGQGVKYPQPSESLTWTGQFYIAVQFRDDELDWEIIRAGASETRLISGPSVALIEIPE